VQRWWAVVVGCALLAVPTVLRPGSDLAGSTYLLGLTLLVSGVWVGALKCVGTARQTWILIALAASCWLVGDVVQRLLELAGAGNSEVGPPDVFWLGSYPLLVAGVVLMIRARGLGSEVLREIQLDVVATTVAATVGIWQLLLAPEIAGGSLDLFNAVAVLYPLSDIAILALIITLVLAPGVRTTPSIVLIACFGLTLVMDLLYSVLPSRVPEFNTARMDGALLVVNSLLAAAALHPGRAELVERVLMVRTQRMHRWRIVLLGAALGGVSVASALSSDSVTNRFVLLSASLTISGIILMRFYKVIRDRELAEEQLAHQANHDQLTGLANRGLLLHAVTMALFVPLGDRPRDFALLYIDLDGFKAINDTHGHAAGDDVLRTVSQRLKQFTRPGDTVARLGGDEFVMLCLDVDAARAETLGQQVRAAVQVPMTIDGIALQIGSSIGVLAATDIDHRHLMDAEQVLQAADSAMYIAKRQGGGVRTCRRLAVPRFTTPAVVVPERWNYPTASSRSGRRP
jgi:diguanylate cyclase (GGDEF)-like protein